MLRKIAMAIVFVLLLNAVPAGSKYVSAADSKTYEIPVGAEGFKDNDGFYNNGDSGFNYVGVGNFGQTIAALQFNLSGITESVITEAALAIEVNQVLENSGDVMFIDLIAAADDSWANGTPNRLPNGDPWTTIYRESSDLPDEGSPPSTFTFDNKAAIGSFVQSELNGDQLISFVLEGNETKSNPAGITELRFNVDTAKLIVKTAVNTGPIASSGTLAVTEDTVRTGALAGTDADGDPLTYSIVSQGSKGTVAITNTATGAYTYTPNANATGGDSFTFRVNDGTVNSAAATVTVTIAAVNDAPTANTGTLSVLENTSKSGTLTGSDVDGDALTFSVVTQGSKGSVTITNATTGAYTYTPNANATGGDSFTFRVNDGTVNSALATVTVTITDVNVGPTATAGTLSVTEDTTKSGTLIGTDADGDPLTFSIVSQGSKGTVAITNAATGAYTYTPNANVTGGDSFTFRVNDGTVDSAAATVTVTIAAVNDAPTANAGTLAVTEDTSKSGTLTGSDVDGDALTFSVATQGSKGSVTITNATTGAYTYSPNANATGSDSLTFRVNDGTVNSAAATVTVTIAAVNDAPTANAGTLSVLENTSKSGTLTGSDVDGDALTYSIVSQGSKGAVAITNAATGAYTYTPNANATGSDSFTFKVNDGTVNSALATVTVTITDVNVGPTATAGMLSVTEDTTKSGTLIGTDADGDPLTYSIVSQGSKGTVAITNAATGAYTYTPNANATSSDSFTFKVNDGTVDSAAATVTVTIAAVNDAPTANAGTLAVTEDTSKSDTLTGSDVDGDALTYSVVMQGSKGTVAITNAATGAYTYTPNANATGSDSFTFKVNDGTVDSAAATVTVTITEPIDTLPPVTLYHFDPIFARNNAGKQYVSGFTITLRATDPEAGSGVMTTLYRINGGEWIPYSGSFTITAGTTKTVEYYSMDYAGNMEEPMNKMDFVNGIFTGAGSF